VNLDEAIANHKAADKQLLAAMRAAQAAGTTANEIARRVAGLRGYSRPLVLELLGAESLREKAERVLRDAGWDLDIGGDARVYLGPKREVLVDLTGEDEPGGVNALNAASALCTALHKGGLGTYAGGDPDPYQRLGHGETIEITD
jgi:hypothetical protein